MSKVKIIVIIILTIIISGCSVKEKLEWTDNKLGEIFEFSEEVQEEANIATSSEEYISEANLGLEIKEKIGEWLEENNYNRYGDAIGTFYPGGSPLFNEVTGESINRYDYIFDKFPDLLNKLK